MRFEEIPEYRRDLKGLMKKYGSLEQDLEVVKKVLALFPDHRPPFSFRIEGLGISSCIIKVKKIACRSLKGRGANSGLRLIYAFLKEQERIVFIEIFHKNEKALEDRERIKRHFS